jgi:prepilin-type N-terminal cleavage/methylation domain-containing protein
MTNRGVSLLELMIAIAVITILTGIAIPLYSGYIREGHFVSMRTTLNGMRTSIEDYRLENGNYGTADTLANMAAIQSRFDWHPSGDAKAYEFGMVIASTNSYDVYGEYKADPSIWVRCDNRYQTCCDADSTGSATLTNCP